MYISPLAFKVLMSVSSKWIPYPRVFGFFLKFWSNSPPWCWPPRRSNSPFERGSQNANYNQRLAKKRPEKKHLFRHLILTTNCKICIYYVFKRMLWNFGTLSCSTVTTYPQQIRCAWSIKVASSPSTFREQNECFANTIFFHSKKVKLLLSRFRQHHLVSTATEATRSRPRCSVSCHMINVVKWPNVIANYLEKDNVMLAKRREKRFRESSHCCCGINFFFPKNFGETTFELKFGCESVSKESVWSTINPLLSAPLFSGKECF